MKGPLPYSSALDLKGPKGIDNKLSPGCSLSAMGILGKISTAKGILGDCICWQVPFCFHLTLSLSFLERCMSWHHYTSEFISPCTFPFLPKVSWGIYTVTREGKLVLSLDSIQSFSFPGNL